MWFGRLAATFRRDVSAHLLGAGATGGGAAVPFCITSRHLAPSTAVCIARLFLQSKESEQTKKKDSDFFNQAFFSKIMEKINYCGL